MTLDHLYLTKTAHVNDVYCFVLSNETQLHMHCGLGYHIFLAGFEEAWFEDQSTPFRCSHLEQGMVWNPVVRIFKDVVAYLSNPRTQKRWLRLCQHLSSPTPTMPLLATHGTLLTRILPLVNTPYLPSQDRMPTPLHDPSMYDMATIQQEIQRMFDVFYKEYTALSGMFLRPGNLERMLEDWIDYLVAFKKEFFANPEQTMGMLRKVLYQYMIEHKYTHISFKSFDVSRMVIGLYTWSEWYERYLQLIVHATFDPSTLHEETLRTMACLELFFDRDMLQQPSLVVRHPQRACINVHFFSIQIPDTNTTTLPKTKKVSRSGSTTYHTLEVPYLALYETLAPIHPMLRSSVIYGEWYDCPPSK